MNKLSLQELTPSIYYNQSRDFQYIGRLYDTVLNYVKTNSDLIYNLPLSDNSDDRLIDLMTLTLGFKSKHNYNIKQLSALCSAFTYIIRNKGNTNSILTAINTLLNAEGINAKAEYNMSSTHEINLFIPQALTDINLLKDLLIYILPAGISCNIIRELSEEVSATTTLTTGDKIQVFGFTDEYGKVLPKTAWTETNTNELSVVANAANNAELIAADAKNTAGLTPMTEVYQSSNITRKRTTKTKNKENANGK